MSTNPQTLRDLGAFWTAQGGVNLGVVGNAAHTSGYHLGRDRIYDGTGPGLSDADYSVKLARDKAGLTNAASAIDLGKLGGTLANLRAFSSDLVKRCTANAMTRRDVREVIYSPDGVKVQRWSGVDNAIHTGAGNGDSSHLAHTHISFYRDSESRSKRPLFAPYFAPVEADMPPITSYAPGLVATIKATANVRSSASVTAPVLRVVATGETWLITGWVKGGVDPESGSDQWLVRWNADKWEYTAKSNATVPVDPTPFTAAQLAAAAAAAKLKAEVASAAATISAAVKANSTGYNAGLTAAQAAVTAVKRR